jgi:1-deoxy-D-xylulose-5-phosphate synthase
MINTAVQYPGPIAFRYPRGKGIGVDVRSSLHALEIGKGELLREGDDVVIVAIGSTVVSALRAADVLEEMGIRPAVINARFLKPLDAELIVDWVARTGRVVTVEENVLQGGFGSAVLELLQEKGLHDIRVKRLGIPDLFVEHGPQPFLRAKYGIDEGGIVSGVKQLVEERTCPSVCPTESTSMNGALSNSK